MGAEELEVWENTGMASHYLKKYNSAGQEVYVCIQGRQRVHMTPAERRINQEIAADSSLDVFKNGTLIPVRLIDSEPDTKELQSNSNAMSETKMKALFKSQMPTFTAKVNEISNPSALSRLIEIASEVDASIRQVETIQNRLNAVAPQIADASRIPGTSAIGTKAPQGENRMPKGVTPK